MGSLSPGGASAAALFVVVMAFDPLGWIVP